MCEPSNLSVLSSLTEHHACFTSWQCEVTHNKCHTCVTYALMCDECMCYAVRKFMKVSLSPVDVGEDQKQWNFDQKKSHAFWVIYHLYHIFLVILYPENFPVLSLGSDVYITCFIHLTGTNKLFFLHSHQWAFNLLFIEDYLSKVCDTLGNMIPIDVEKLLRAWSYLPTHVFHSHYYS